MDAASVSAVVESFVGPLPQDISISVVKATLLNNVNFLFIVCFYSFKYQIISSKTHFLSMSFGTISPFQVKKRPFFE